MGRLVLVAYFARTCLDAVESVLSPKQPTRFLCALGPNFGLDHLAAAINLGSYGCLIGVHHVLIICVKVGRTKSQHESWLVGRVRFSSMV
jgi:hypothetical protein